jgi:hypothetical protein
MTAATVAQAPSPTPAKLHFDSQLTIIIRDYPQLAFCLLS